MVRDQDSIQQERLQIILHAVSQVLSEFATLLDATQRSESCLKKAYAYLFVFLALYVKQRSGVANAETAKLPVMSFVKDLSEVRQYAILYLDYCDIARLRPKHKASRACLLSAKDFLQ